MTKRLNETQIVGILKEALIFDEAGEMFWA